MPWKWKRKKARIKQNERIVNLKLTLRINGRDILGPITLEGLYLIKKFGGYSNGIEWLSLSRGDYWITLYIEDPSQNE